MTEKEFIDSAVEFLANSLGVARRFPTPNELELCRIAIELSKSCGAKFDPEPIRVPPLKVIESGFHDGYRIILQQSRNTASGMTHLLTKEQAEEIIRRCELIPELRQEIKSGANADRLLKWVDGKIWRA